MITSTIDRVLDGSDQNSRADIIRFCDNLLEAMVRELSAGGCVRIGRNVDTEPVTDQCDYGSNIVDHRYMGETVTVQIGRGVGNSMTPVAQVEKLSPRPGDVLVLRMPGEQTPESKEVVIRAGEDILRHLRESGRGEPLMVGLWLGMSLEQLDEGEMREWGWVRAPSGQCEATFVPSPLAKAFPAWQAGEAAALLPVVSDVCPQCRQSLPGCVLGDVSKRTYHFACASCGPLAALSSRHCGCSSSG